MPLSPPPPDTVKFRTCSLEDTVWLDWWCDTSQNERVLQVDYVNRSPYPVTFKITLDDGTVVAESTQPANVETSMTLSGSNRFPRESVGLRCGFSPR